MTIRNRKNDTPGLADLESANNPMDAPGPLPPPGVPAQVETRIRYERPIDTGGYSEDLRSLAAEELEDDLPEPEFTDPCQQFLSTWQRFTGYYLKVVRLPDPATNLLPGQSFNRQCRELTMLGTTTFDPANFEHTLQILAGNSGGVFRVFLIDTNGQPIPGARLERVTIADPPRYDNRQSDPRYPGYEITRNPYPSTPAPITQPPPQPQKSENDLFMEQLQRNFFEKAVMRAIDPPPPPTPDPFAGMSERDRLALSLLKEGDNLSGIVDRISSLAQAPDKIESATWKDKLADAGIQVITQNPQIIATVTDIASRTVAALASAFAPRPQQVINEPIPIVQHPPAQRVPVPQIPQPVPAPQAVNGLPETPQEDDEDEDTEIELMEELVKLMLSDKPLDLSDPLFRDLQEDYGDLFSKAMIALAVTPTATVIQYLCSKNDFLADLFNSQRNGPYLRQRLEEFKVLLAAPQSQPETTNATTETVPAPA